ncbi:MAG: SPFH domain-containing protein [Candidatus ainarchaeum sp.]|nr:SPFH domain-containing protein [Candidatus ainarchaeum sp.]
MVSASFKYVIFVAIIALVLIVAGFTLTNADFFLSNIYWLVILGVFFYIIWKYDFIVQLLDYERAVIYRFGKLNRVGGPGWTFIWPIIESYTHVDLRTKTIDVEKQDVITKDGIELTVDAIIYLRVKKDRQSVVNSVIEVEDYVNASQLFVISAIRDVVGTMLLSEVISKIEIINAHITENLEKISSNWGVGVESVELKDVQIPEIVLQAMHEEKAAVQQKLARMQRALAHSAEIDAVKESAKGLDDKALAYYYIKAIEGMSKSKGSKVFFPAEFSNLAKTFSSTQLAKASESGEVGKYKKLLEDYVEAAVKKTKKPLENKQSKKKVSSKKNVKKVNPSKKKIVSSKKKVKNKK